MNHYSDKCSVEGCERRIGAKDHMRMHTKGKTNEMRSIEKALYGHCLAGKP